jgi:mannose-1-phosphate guanylyltransferase
VHDVLDKDADGNVLVGEVLASGCRDCYVSANARVVAALGLEGVVIVETEDAVLVMSKREAQRVRWVVDEVAKRGRE